MKRSEILLMILQVPVDFVMLILASTTAYFVRIHPSIAAIKPVEFDITLLEYLGVSILVAIVWQIIFAFFGLYSTDPNRKLGKDLVRVAIACTVGLGVIAIYIMFSLQLFDSRFLILASWIIAIVFVTIGRLMIRGYKSVLYRSGVGLRRLVIVGKNPMTKMLVQTLKKRKELGYKVVAVLSAFTPDVEKKILTKNIDEILIINPRAKEKETLRAIDFCADHHITLKYSADLFSTYPTNTRVEALAGIPIAEMRKGRLTAWGRVLKRVFDIIVSLIALIITSPIIVLTAIIILIETGRPIIYKNERIGVRGRHFFTYKFRSMYQKDSTGKQFGASGKKAEEKEKELIKKLGVREGPVYKIAHDPRVTPFGRFIRRLSIDELPQFINVLKGEMSVVGPRPHQPREVEGHKLHHREVLTIKPGITGLAQISGRSDIPFEEEVKLDILYIESWSLMLDAVILIKTPFILFKKRKAV